MSVIIEHYGRFGKQVGDFATLWQLTKEEAMSAPFFYEWCPEKFKWIELRKTGVLNE